MIAIAVAWLTYIWRIRAARLQIGALVVSGLLNGTSVLLVADLLWQLPKSLCPYCICPCAGRGASAGGLACRDRLRTLLPLSQHAGGFHYFNLLTIRIGLGVQSAADCRAGIFGVAIGFGSQTLVKDVLSGIFEVAGRQSMFRTFAFIRAHQPSPSPRRRPHSEPSASD